MTLQVKDINKTFDVSKGLIFGPRKRLVALRDVSFVCEAGSSLGIVGESGSGKTTLAKILAGFFEADHGTATLAGLDLINMTHQRRANLVQMVFQDPFASLNPKLHLRTQLAEAVAQANKDKIGELMSDVGLSVDFLTRYPHQLSGGQRQRFAIARSLARQPSLLIADEPVSSLDVSIQSQIIELLNSLRVKRKFTLIVISHDLAVIANLCDYVLVMKGGEILERGEVAQVLGQPSHPYTQRLLEATPVL